MTNVLTCDQNHDYTPEQYAFDDGKMDKFTADRRHATTGRHERERRSRARTAPSWTTTTATP